MRKNGSRWTLERIITEIEWSYMSLWNVNNHKQFTIQQRGYKIIDFVGCLVLLCFASWWFFSHLSTILFILSLLLLLLLLVSSVFVNKRRTVCMNFEAFRNHFWFYCYDNVHVMPNKFTEFLCCIVRSDLL